MLFKNLIVLFYRHQTHKHTYSTMHMLLHICKHAKWKTMTFAIFVRAMCDAHHHQITKQHEIYLTNVFHIDVLVSVIGDAAGSSFSSFALSICFIQLLPA